MAEISRDPQSFGLSPSDAAYKACSKCERLSCPLSESSGSTFRSSQSSGNYKSAKKCLKECYLDHARAHKNMDYCSLVYTVRELLGWQDFARSSGWKKVKRTIKGNTVFCGNMGTMETDYCRLVDVSFDLKELMKLVNL